VTLNAWVSLMLMLLVKMPAARPYSVALARAMASASASNTSKVATGPALKRRLTPDDTAAAVAYLASDAAAAMTGQVLCADGSRALMRAGEPWTAGWPGR
jgi:NAD(P)-dependent dehydrogenase (short-subunit alcohol dehydrogenase family)